MRHIPVPHPTGALCASKSAPGRFVIRIGLGRFSPSQCSGRSAVPSVRPWPPIQESLLSFFEKSHYRASSSLEKALPGRPRLTSTVSTNFVADLASSFSSAQAIPYSWTIPSSRNSSAYHIGHSGSAPMVAVNAAWCTRPVSLNKDQQDDFEVQYSMRFP